MKVKIGIPTKDVSPEDRADKIYLSFPATGCFIQRLEKFMEQNMTDYKSLIADRFKISDENIYTVEGLNGCVIKVSESFRNKRGEADE